MTEVMQLHRHGYLRNCNGCRSRQRRRRSRSVSRRDCLNAVVLRRSVSLCAFAFHVKRSQVRLLRELIPGLQRSRSFSVSVSVCSDIRYFPPADVVGREGRMGGGRAPRGSRTPARSELATGPDFCRFTCRKLVRPMHILRNRPGQITWPLFEKPPALRSCYRGNGLEGLLDLQIVQTERSNDAGVVPFVYSQEYWILY